MRTSALPLLLLALALAGCTTTGGPTTAPAAPAAVLATPGAGFIRLVWQDTSATEDQFIIGRVELPTAHSTFDAAALTELTRVTADQVVFRDTAQSPGRYYGYGVAAVNGAGRSAYTLQSGPPMTALVAGAGNPCQVAVPSADDLDGDGLSNDAEAAGWTTHVDQNGKGSFADTAVTSAVNSPPLPGR